MDIFISYRRNGGIDIARNIWNELRERSYYSFFDLDSIQEGEFPKHIYQNIVRSKTFITTESGEAVTAGTSAKKGNHCI